MLRKVIKALTITFPVEFTFKNLSTFLSCESKLLIPKMDGVLNWIFHEIDSFIGDDPVELEVNEDLADAWPSCSVGSWAANLPISNRDWVQKLSEAIE